MCVRACVRACVRVSAVDYEYSHAEHNRGDCNVQVTSESSEEMNNVLRAW